jgi:hypothetical protein
MARGSDVIVTCDRRLHGATFVIDKVALGQGFLRVLRFPLPILIPLTAPHPLIILSSMLYSFDTEGVVK